MSINVESFVINTRVFGETRDAEVEAVVDDGKLREGQNGIRRFWLLGYERPFYLGHVTDSTEREAIISKVKAAFEANSRT